jgi:AraC-like DNA-binding protein
MGLVATLLPVPLRQERVRAALRDRHGLVSCDSWDGLLTACARKAVTVALVDLYPDAPGTDTTASFDALRRLRRRFPSVTVVLYTSSSTARPHDLFEAGRFGMEGLVLADQDDDPRRLRAIIDQAEARGAIELLRPALTDVKPTVRDALLLCVTRAHQQLKPDDLAAVLGLRRKLLSERLVSAGFPTSQRLIAWGRLIVAARLLEDPERTADGVALALDYPSGSAFRNACQRYVHAAPHQVRARGGAGYVIKELLAQAGHAPGATPAPMVTPASPHP